MHAGAETFSKIYFKHSVVKTENNFMYFGGTVDE